MTYDNEFIMADARLEWELPDGELYVFPGKGILAAWSMPGEMRYRVFAATTPKPGPSTSSGQTVTSGIEVATSAARSPTWPPAWRE